MSSQARVFLERLFAGKAADLYILLWTLEDKRSRWFKNIESAIQFADSRRERDLYVGVGLSGQDYGPSRRCLSSEVTGIVALWADLDLRSDAHPKAALPLTIDDALKILPERFPPTFVISTGNGAQAWWCFSVPLIFESDEQRQDIVNLALRWQSLLRLNAASRGWAFDRLADLARVLRVPGTQNCKDPASPKPVEIYCQTDRRFNPSELAEYLDHQEIPDDETQERAAQAWKVHSADKQFALDPSATVSDELLDRYMGSDAQFEKTWLRQRDDLKDQSQSGYDLALANFGLKIGLSEQQVIELIIHHRRIHCQRPRTRLDYYQRTIAKAFPRNENTTPTHSFGTPTQQAGQPAPQTKPDSPTARALLCEQISNAIGVRVLRIVKIAGQEPTYRVELETAKIAFASIDKLVGQHSFRMKIGSAVEYLFPRIPAKVWDRVAQMMLNAMTVEDGGDEADLVGAARIYVERYLSETPFIDAEQDHPYQTRFKPTVYEGRIAICSHDLQQHINKMWGENRAIKEVTAMLSALGASSTRLKRTRLRDQSRWLLPSSDLVPYSSIGTNGERDNVKPS